MIRSMLVSPIRRYFVTKKMFRTAEEIAEKKQKKLMMIGDPCSWNYFQFMSKMFPNSGHGDVTLDLFGCDSLSQNGHQRYRCMEGLRGWGIRSY